MRVGPKLLKSALQHHSEMQVAHETAAEAVGEGPAREFHKTAAASHAQCASTLEECTKAIAAEDLEKGDRIVPSQVSRVVPTAPNIRAVPRAGQPSAPAPVPEEFAKLVAVEDSLD